MPLGRHPSFAAPSDCRPGSAGSGGRAARRDMRSSSSTPPRPSMPSLPPGHSQPLACALATRAGLPGLRSAHAPIRHGRRRCRLPVPSSRSRRPSRGRAAAHHSILSPRVANRRRVSRPTKRKKDGGTEGRAWRPTKRKLTLLHPCGLRDQVRTSAGT